MSLLPYLRFRSLYGSLYGNQIGDTGAAAVGKALAMNTTLKELE